MDFGVTDAATKDVFKDATDPASEPVHLAQLNIAHLNAPLDSPQLADFVGSLDRINALAEQTPGFVWRLQTDDGDATALRPLGDTTLVNMSVWSGIEALRQYVYRSDHAALLRRRWDWFEPMTEAAMVLWWVPAGHQPTVTEAIERLQQLRQLGPGPQAFTFKQAFDPDGQPYKPVVAARA